MTAPDKRLHSRISRALKYQVPGGSGIAFRFYANKLCNNPRTQEGILVLLRLYARTEFLPNDVIDIPANLIEYAFIQLSVTRGGAKRSSFVGQLQSAARIPLVPDHRSKKPLPDAARQFRVGF